MAYRQTILLLTLFFLIIPSARADFPIVSSAQGSAVDVNADTITVTLPSTIAANDLVLCGCTVDNATRFLDWDTGATYSWTPLVTDNNGAVSQIEYFKAAGTEDSGTFIIDIYESDQVTPSTEEISCYCAAITGWDGTTAPEYSSFDNAQAAETTPDPATLDPTNWGTEDTLWIVYSGFDGGDNSVSAYITSFINTFEDATGGASTGVFVTFQTIASATSSLDPAAYTITTSARPMVFTIAIRPSASAVSTQVYRRRRM